MHDDIYIERFAVAPGAAVDAAALPTSWEPSGRFADLANLSDKAAKKRAKKFLKDQRRELSDLQERLYASDTYSVLLVFQGRDAAGKDSTIKHVMSGVNPQGCEVTSFKAPSKTELDHNYLWRCWQAVPSRGRIGIFNRSHYEEVLVVRVHPGILKGQNLPAHTVTDDIWSERYEDINAFERHLARNGTLVLKFWLNVSQAEQRQRFLDRLNEPDKTWKFSASDLKESRLWGAYDDAIGAMLSHTSTAHAPWYTIPADNKWSMRSVMMCATSARMI
ncbi:MAG: PPK2 family polyphosphate kinase, partial [Pseudomonadota bacterium]